MKICFMLYYMVADLTISTCFPGELPWIIVSRPTRLLSSLFNNPSSQAIVTKPDGKSNSETELEEENQHEESDSETEMEGLPNINVAGASNTEKESSGDSSFSPLE